MRPSLMRSSSVSVRDRPILHKGIIAAWLVKSIIVCHVGSIMFDGDAGCGMRDVNVPAPAIELIICLGAHLGKSL